MGLRPLIFVITLIYAHRADTISFNIDLYMLYISWLEIFCIFYIVELVMFIYSYKHSLDLGSKLDAFMHSLFELSAFGLVVHQSRILL